MELGTLIVYLATILTTPVYANLTQEKLKLVAFMHEQAEVRQIEPEKLIRLASCESELLPTARGDWSKEKKKHFANGIFQWWEPSFNLYSKKYKIAGDYRNSRDQIRLAAIVIQNEGAHPWTNCAGRVNLALTK